MQYSITGVGDADDDKVARRIDAGLGLLLLLLELERLQYSITGVFSDGRRSDDLRLSATALLRNPITAAGELSMN